MWRSQNGASASGFILHGLAKPKYQIGNVMMSTAYIITLVGRCRPKVSAAPMARPAAAPTAENASVLWVSIHRTFGS